MFTQDEAIKIKTLNATIGVDKWIKNNKITDLDEPLLEIKIVEPKNLPCIKNRPSSMHSRTKTI